MAFNFFLEMGSLQNETFQSNDKFYIPKKSSYIIEALYNFKVFLYNCF